MAVKVDAHKLTVAVEEMTKDIEELITKETKWLRDELVRTTPIDTGKMKDNWTNVAQSGWVWTFRNLKDYASIIARGRRSLNGRMYGSIQNGWSAGITPFFRKFDKRIEKEFNAKQY